MTKREKRLARIRRNPKNVRQEELDAVLRDFDFDPDFTLGSHVTYRHPSGVRITIVAHGGRVPAYIVRQALKAIDSVIEAHDNEDEAGGKNEDE